MNGRSNWWEKKMNGKQYSYLDNMKFECVNVHDLVLQSECSE